MRRARITHVIFIVAVLLCLPLLRLSAQSAHASIDPLLDGSALNDVWVHINATDWQNLHATYQTNTYYPVDFEWNGNRVSNAGIRVKGQSTRNPQKPSFRIDFNRYVDNQEFLGETALVLNSSWADPSSIRDRVSMALFRLMGIPAPRQANVRLYVGPNREYAGVYAVSEEVDKKFLDEHFGDHSGYLYAYNNDPAGNYWRFDDRGPDLGWYIDWFEPKTHETASNFDLYQPLENMVHQVNAAPPDADLATWVGGVFDLNTYITELAIQNFVDQTDGLLGGVGMNNFFFYRFPNSAYWTIIPWDQDQSFTQLDEPAEQNMTLSVLANRIWNQPQYRDQYLSTIVSIGQQVGTPAGGPPGWLEQEVTNDANQVRDAVYQDPLKPFSSDDFENAVALMLQFAQQRDGYERSFVAQLAPEALAAAPAASASGLAAPSGTSRIRSLRVPTSK